MVYKWLRQLLKLFGNLNRPLLQAGAGAKPRDTLPRMSTKTFGVRPWTGLTHPRDPISVSSGRRVRSHGAAGPYEY
jgi:hypothetical protein